MTEGAWGRPGILKKEALSLWKWLIENAGRNICVGGRRSINL